MSRGVNLVTLVDLVILMNLAHLVLDQSGIRGDGSQDAHELSFGVEPVVEVVMNVMEVLELIKKVGSFLASLLELLPSVDDLIEVVIKNLSSSSIGSLLQQIPDVNLGSVQLSLILIQLVQDTLIP